MRFALFLLIVFVFSASGQARDRLGLHSLKEPQSKHYQDHPLAGKMYSAFGKSASVKDLSAALKTTEFLLVGEVHNNPDHHLLQASILAAFAFERASRPDVVFEMVPKRLQKVLDEAKLGDDLELRVLAEDLEWEKRGWYSWKIYLPIFQQALDAGLALKAGNLDREHTRMISRSGINSLPPGMANRLMLSRWLSPAMAASLKAELKDSHCGLLPETALAPMANVQRARDGAMAAAMLASGSRGAVLIAGNGHVRKDRGVPRLLKGENVLVVGLLEVHPNAIDPADYGLINNQGDPLYDYVIFTPKHDITDHCAAMREQFKKTKKKSK